MGTEREHEFFLKEKTGFEPVKNRFNFSVIIWAGLVFH
jgi:hypothetical protein